jgi:MFS family permease
VGRYTDPAIQRLLGGPPKELPAPFWWLWASTLVNRIANFVVPFSVLYLTTERSVSEPMAGLLIGLFGAGGVAGSLLGGTAADRYGAKRILVAGSLAGASTTFLLGLAVGLLTLSAVIFFVGLFNGITRPATSALIAELVPPACRVRVFALNYWAMNLGFAIACLCAGFATAIGYTALFSIDGASTLACGMMVLALVRTSSVPRRQVVERTQRRRIRITSFPAPLRDRLFVAVIMATVVTTALLQQLTATLPLAMHASGHPPAAYGAIAALNGLLVCTLQMPISLLSAKRPLLLSLMVGTLLMGIGFGLTAFTTSIAGYAVTLVIWTIGEIVAAPASPALVAQLAREGHQGAYQGVLNSAWSVGAIIGPAIGTAAFAHWAARGLWLLCGCTGLAVGAGYHTLKRPMATRLAIPRIEAERTAMAEVSGT